MARGANRRIGYLIKWVERGVRRELDAALRPLGVTTPEYTALSVLGQREGLSSAQLARRSFVTDQAMNQIVIALERRGWIERSAGAAHAKTRPARLTRAGSERLRACDHATAHVERGLLKGLSPVQVDALQAALESCATALRGQDSTRASKTRGANSKLTGVDAVASRARSAARAAAQPSASSRRRRPA